MMSLIGMKLWNPHGRSDNQIGFGIICHEVSWRNSRRNTMKGNTKVHAQLKKNIGCVKDNL